MEDCGWNVSQTTRRAGLTTGLRPIVPPGRRTRPRAAEPAARDALFLDGLPG